MTDKPPNPYVYPQPAAPSVPTFAANGNVSIPMSTPASPGMTLRDYFASQAPEPPIYWWGASAVKDCAGYALWNYQYADAMLLERVK